MESNPYSGIFEGYSGGVEIRRPMAVSGPYAGTYGPYVPPDPNITATRYPVRQAQIAAPAQTTAPAAPTSAGAGQVGSSIDYANLIGTATKGIGDSLALGIMAGAKNTPTINSPDGFTPALASYQLGTLPGARGVSA